ncbi:hypothetical protein BDK61_4405 [Haloarcula quadrata]|uniref:Uncharacterized protein n=1 Tax=Haloarcula quadrata TaxID=182779 RepID=A0A495QQU7_9EURY|nr:hypothetical protein BDK61_4405 [Haloarcula quadrata]
MGAGYLKATDHLYCFKCNIRVSAWFLSVVLCFAFRGRIVYKDRRWLTPRRAVPSCAVAVSQHPARPSECRMGESPAAQRSEQPGTQRLQGASSFRRGSAGREGSSPGSRATPTRAFDFAVLCRSSRVGLKGARRWRLPWSRQRPLSACGLRGYVAERLPAAWGFQGVLVRHRVCRRDVARSSAVEAISPADVSSPAKVSRTADVSATSPAIRTAASLGTVTSAIGLDSRASSARIPCSPHTRHTPPEPSPPALGPRTGSTKSERAAQRRLPGGQTTHQPATRLCPAVSPTPTHTRLSRSQPACQPHAAIHQSYLCFARPSAPRCKGPTTSGSAVVSLSSPTACDSDMWRLSW